MKNIVIIKQEGKGYKVMVDDMFEDALSPDEALGVVAAALFGGMERPRYVKTWEEHAQRVQLYQEMFGKNRSGAVRSSRKLKIPGPVTEKEKKK